MVLTKIRNSHIYSAEQGQRIEADIQYIFKAGSDGSSQQPELNQKNQRKKFSPKRADWKEWWKQIKHGQLLRCNSLSKQQNTDLKEKNISASDTGHQKSGFC